MKELLMLSDTLMKYQIHFSFIWHMQKKDSVILCKTPHTAKETFRALRRVFGEVNGEDRIISKGLWPPGSPDFYLWGKLKNVYANNPRDLETLKQNIREAICNIQQRELQQVSRNLFTRIQACLTASGRYFEHLL
jgi:hypothetical protein